MQYYSTKYYINNTNTVLVLHFLRPLRRFLRSPMRILPVLLRVQLLPFFTLCIERTPLDAKLVGCYSHRSQNLISKWKLGLDYPGCARFAAKNAQPWFVLEYPQGHSALGVANCGYGGDFEADGRLSDSACRSEIDPAGRPLGSGAAFAVYRFDADWDLDGLVNFGGGDGWRKMAVPGVATSDKINPFPPPHSPHSNSPTASDVNSPSPPPPGVTNLAGPDSLLIGGTFLPSDNNATHEYSAVQCSAVQCSAVGVRLL